MFALVGRVPRGSIRSGLALGDVAGKTLGWVLPQIVVRGGGEKAMERLGVESVGCYESSFVVAVLDVVAAAAVARGWKIW